MRRPPVKEPGVELRKLLMSRSVDGSWIDGSLRRLHKALKLRPAALLGASFMPLVGLLGARATCFVGALLKTVKSLATP